MTRFVLWDLDGTLIDSGDDIVSAANALRAELGLVPLPSGLVRSFIGEGAARLVEQVVGHDTSVSAHPDALPRFLRLYEQNLVVRTRPYPGIDRLVRSLEGRQAIATNKPSHFSRRIVEGLGWSSLFRANIGADDVERRKPAPDAVFRALELSGVRREEAVFVGDTPIDIATAKAAGIDFICVSWGLRPRHELLEAPVIVDDADELEEAILRLDGVCC
jgi:phosphoglycolate phosphatase